MDTNEVFFEKTKKNWRNGEKVCNFATDKKNKLKVNTGLLYL